MNLPGNPYEDDIDYSQEVGAILALAHETRMNALAIIKTAMRDLVLPELDRQALNNQLLDGLDLRKEETDG